MKFYNEKEPLYLETDISGVRFGAGLLHMRERMWIPKMRHLKTRYYNQ